MIRSLPKTVVTLLVCAALGAGLWRGARAHAQLPGLGTIEGFDANEYYAPANTQLAWRITGAKAQPQAGNRYLLSGMQLRMFGPTGERKLVVEAPACLYDYVTRSASSPGRLKVQIEEGRLELEGTGFLWQQTEQTNSTLTISNQVHATVQHTMINPPGGATASVMVITSRQFEFVTAKHQAVFQDEVHAEDADIEFKCGRLTANASTDGGAFDALTAEGSVAITGKTDGLAAIAEHAFYARTNEMMALTGKVAWKQGAQEGRAERATIRRLEREFGADGNVAVKLPRAALGFGGLLPGGTNIVTPVTNLAARVDLFADHLQVSSNLTVIQGAVRVRDETNQLSCDKIVVESFPANAGQTAIADGHVVICHGDADQCLRSDRAVYTKSTGTVVFTGHPTWKLSPSEGRAECVTVHDSGEIQAAGDVAARVTMAAQSNSFLNLFPNAADTIQATRVIEVFARELKASERRISLQGNARLHQSPITGSEPHLQCATLDLFFATNSHHVELMQAKDQVRFEQGTAGVTNGPNAYRLLTAGSLTAAWNSPTGALSNFIAEGGVQAEQAGSVANGQRAAYTSATDVLELTGQPTLDTPEATITGADKIIWDKKSSGFSVRGRYQVTGRPGALKRKLEAPPPR
jgi:lipopolysaccharide export system protein LptA